MKFSFINSTKKKVNLVAFLPIFLALSIGFSLRFLCFIKYTTFDIGPSPDQVRDAFIYMDMWQGEFPTLGPSASATKYSLPPLYYYLVFPSTIFSTNPISQVLPNVLFSFFTIPLLIYLVYQLLENIPLSLRLLLAGIAGLWYSVIFPEIFISTFHWNPSPIPFFLIGFVLLFKFQRETKTSQIWQIISWSFYGIVLAILVSLHSTAMFVMPLVFAASVIEFVYKYRHNLKKCYLPLFSIAFFFLALIPYWQGEFSRNFSNSKQILYTIFNYSSQANSSNILSRLTKVIFNYFELGQQSYFIGNNWLFIAMSIIFLSLVFCFVIILCISPKIILIARVNISILAILSLTWILYLYAASNFQGTFFIHYKLLFIFAPIIFAVLCLGYLDYNQKYHQYIGILIISGILISIWSNLSFDSKYLLSKYGVNRLVSTADIINVFNKLPNNSTVCEPSYQGSRAIINPYNYIDRYITKKNLKFVSYCQSGNFRLYSRYKLAQSIDNLWPTFKIIENQFNDQNSIIYYEDLSHYVYTIK